MPDKAHWLCITGGEPMEQRGAVEELTRLAHQKQKRVMLQTSGAFLVPDIFDWLVVSPKQSLQHLVQRSGHELKMLYQGQTIEELEQWWTQTKFHRHYLMPIWNNGCNAREVADAALAACERGLPWRVTLQAQKYIQVR